MNLASLDATNGPLALASIDAALQGTSSPSASKMPSREKRLPIDIRLLMEEAVNFLETPREEISLTPSFQSFPRSMVLPHASPRNTCSQVTPHNYGIPSTRFPRNARSRHN